MKVVYGRYTAIKYDCRDRRVNMIMAGIATFFAAAMIILVSSPLGDRMGAGVFTITVLGGAVFCPVVALISWMNFWMSTEYLKRLNTYGYEVPLRKRMYKGLEDLPQSERLKHPKNGSSKESIALSVICWIIAAGCLVGIIPFYVNYQMQEIGIVFCGVAAIFWVVFGLHYFRQRSREKYRDDVEPDEGNMRRVRTHFAEGIVTILILVFFTWVALVILYNLCGVIFRARLLHKTDY